MLHIFIRPLGYKNNVPYFLKPLLVTLISRGFKTTLKSLLKVCLFLFSKPLYYNKNVAYFQTPILETLNH